MITRILTKPITNQESFFLYGPRGVGKTTWVKKNFPQATYIDLGNIETYNELDKSPEKIIEKAQKIPEKSWVIFDEILEVPFLSRYIPELINEKKFKCVFISSNINAISTKLPELSSLHFPSYNLYPLTTSEIGEKHSLEKSLQFGRLPATWYESNPQAFLQIYLYLFLREEILQGKLVQNLASFTRFLEIVSLFQGCDLNLQIAARMTGIPQNVAPHYLEILESLFFCSRLYPFSENSLDPPKFYLFDVGIFKTIHTKKSSMCNKDIDDISLETLLFQEISAINSYFNLGYELGYWTSPKGGEVNFIAKNSKNLFAFTLKNTTNPLIKDYEGLISFYEKHNNSKLYFVYTGDKHYVYNDIEIMPIEVLLQNLLKIMSSENKL